MVAPYPEEESAEWSAPLLAFLEEQFAVLQSNIDHVPESGGDMLGANNGSDFAAPAVVRDNLGLGTAATADIGTDVGQVAAADDPLILGAVQASNNGADFADFVAFRAILDLLSSEEIEALVAGGALTDATFAGIVTAATFIVTGLPGATGTSRYVGATASGHPVSGTFAVGDWVIDLSTGSILVCTVAGSPGTWTVPSSGGGSWGSISGTLSSQSDLNTALGLKAPLASPTFTGTVSGITATMVGLGNVTNTSDANKPVSTAQQTALDLKANLAGPTFTGVGTIPTGWSITAPTGLVKGDVGLGSVDNTADTAKPVSTATQTALNLKANLASPTFTGTVTIPGGASISGYAPLASPTFTGTVAGITSTMVGLGNVDNTSDATKNGATATLSNKTISAGVSAAFISGTLVGGGTSQTGGIVDPITHLHIANAYTLTSTPTSPTVGTPIWIQSDIILNNPTSGPQALVGPVPSSGLGLGPAALITLTGTTQYNVSVPSEFSFPPIVMLDQMVIKNQPGQNRTVSPAWSMLMARCIIGDGATLTLQRPDAAPGVFPYVDTTIYATNNSGTIDGTTNSVWLGSFMSTPFTFGNTHHYRRVGFYAADMNEYSPFGTDLSDAYRQQLTGNGMAPLADTGKGVVDQNIGFYAPYMDGGTLNVGLWNASATVEPPQAFAVVAGTVLTIGSTNLAITTGTGGTLDVTLTTNPWITAGVDGQRVRINSNATTGKITLTYGHGALFADGKDLILMPGSGVDLVYVAAFASWIEPINRTARHLYNGAISTGGAYRLVSTGTNSAALEYRINDTDTNPVASFGMAADVGAIGFGQGTTHVQDWALVYTSAATATISGSLVIATTKLSLGGVTSAALGEANLGLSTLTSHGVILGAGAGAFTALALDASTTKYLKSGGSSAGPSWATINVTDIPTAAPLASPTFTGTVVLPADQILLGSAGVKVWDGTASDGKILFNTTFAGAGIQTIGLFGANGDTSAIVSLTSVSGVSGVSSGIGWTAGGSASADASILRTASAALTVTGQTTFATGITMGSGINIATNTTTGTQFGTSSSQKIGFWGATAIVRGTAFTQTYSTATHTHANITATNPPAGGTGATQGAYDTSVHRDAMITSLTATIADVANVKQVLNGLIDDLQAVGLIA